MTTPLPAREGSKLYELRTQLAAAERAAQQCLMDNAEITRRRDAAEATVQAGDDPDAPDEVVLAALIAQRRLKPLFAKLEDGTRKYQDARDRVKDLRDEATAVEANAWDELRALPEVRRGEKAAAHERRIAEALRHITGYELHELPTPPK
jgi:hypothetical protein